jgi:hypothetical protein
MPARAADELVLQLESRKEQHGRHMAGMRLPWMLCPWWPSGTVPPMKGNATTSSLQHSCAKTEHNCWSTSGSPAIEHLVDVIPGDDFKNEDGLPVCTVSCMQLAWGTLTQARGERCFGWR